MSDDGRPADYEQGASNVFSQEVAEPAAPAVSASPPPEKRLQWDVTNASETPVMECQEALYPDSVRVTGVSYEQFNCSDKAHMQRYSEILMSHKNGGKYKVVGTERVEWHPASCTWYVLLPVQTRVFLRLSTSQTNPPR